MNRRTPHRNAAALFDCDYFGALGSIGSHILALRKSEPSLEDVFVELVGRGFEAEVA